GDREAHVTAPWLCYERGQELDPSPWKFRHSLCWWTALARGHKLEGIEQVDIDRENEDLTNLHTRLQGLADAGPSCPTDEDSSDNSEAEITTTKTYPTADGSHRAPPMTMTATEYEERQKAQARKIELRNNIGRLMREVVRCANFVTVTAAMAAAMHRKDRLMVYGNSIRPFLAVEGAKQLLPALLAMGETYPDGTAINRFGQDAKPPWLS
ncbi:DNA helicase, partial [Fusarium coicis]